MTTQPDLFADLPPVKSPRLLWMDDHCITIEQRTSSTAQCWIAVRKLPGHVTQSEISHTDELDAITKLAIRLNIKLWNQ